MEKHVFVEIAQVHRVPLFDNYPTGRAPSMASQRTPLIGTPQKEGLMIKALLHMMVSQKRPATKNISVGVHLFFWGRRLEDYPG